MGVIVGFPKCTAAAARGDIAEALAAIPSGVAIVTGGSGGGRFGHVAAAVMPVSGRVLVGFDRPLGSLEALARSPRFMINLLGASNRLLAMRARRLAGPSEAQLFSLGCWHELPSGLPALCNAAALLECTLEAVSDGDDHVIFDCRVVRATCHRGVDPIVRSRSGLHGLHPGLDRADSEWEAIL